ncbi:phage tail tube protein [Microbacterium sp. 22242]|uniref:phage tail tube protein n=1 Tax=Microbacterium sp. 22242 TaxID=3453896 RepID=UPI003F841A9B
MPSAFARRFKVDVSADNTTWIALKGINDLVPSENSTLQPADTFDTNGFNSFEKTMTGGKLVAKVLRPTTAGVPSDPGQELARTTRYQFGTQARLYVRWYDRNGAAEAFTMYALVDWNQSKSGVADLDEVTITFTADGAVTAIANPGTAPAAPVVIAATPSGAAAGALVTITGQGFTGVNVATGVKFGAVTAPNALIQSDTQIVVPMPAGSAGSAAVQVTNGIGASNALPYTRG